MPGKRSKYWRMKSEASLLRDAEALGEAEGRDAVDDAEIDRLGLPAQVRRHPVDGHPEHRRGGRRVDVDALREGLLQLRDVGDVGQEPQLDLAVIGRDDLVPGRRHEGRADLAAGLRADRDVLQVRIRRGEAPGRRRGEREGGVDALRLRVHVLLEGVGVGRFQLRELAPFEDLLRQLVPGLGELVEERRRASPTGRTASSWRRAAPSCRTGCRRSASASRARRSRPPSRGSRPRAAPASARNRPTGATGSGGRP